jgi:hypothetical protein
VQLSKFRSWQLHFAYNILSTCEGSGVHETSPVDVAVASLNAAVRHAIEQGIFRGYSCKSKFPLWFCNTLRYYTIKKNCSRHRFKNKRLG